MAQTSVRVLIAAFRFREQRLSIKSELQIRKKALTDDNFPSQEIIDEFFQTPIEMKHLELDWSQPNVIKFLVFKIDCYFQ